MNFFSTQLKSIFLPSGPKVPLSLPSPDRECYIFGLARQKNRVCTMGANKEEEEPSARVTIYMRSGTFVTFTP